MLSADRRRRLFVAIAAQPTVFSYGTVETDKGLAVQSPDGEMGVMTSFAALSKNVPEPFKRETNGGAGMHIHDKFVVVDFNAANPTVFTGSSNLAAGGEQANGDSLARIFVRRGLHLNSYNAYQSIVRGGHILLTLRTSDQPVLSMGDKLDMLVTLNQDTMDRHLGLMGSGSLVLFNADKIRPGTAAEGVQLCPFSVKELAPSAKGDLVQNTIALAAGLLSPGLAARAIIGRRGPPIIMVSALTRDGADITLRALEIGAVDFIPKPDSALIDIVHVQRDPDEMVKHFGSRRVYLRAMRDAIVAAPNPLAR